ncbi:MAG: hypothetical protein ACQES0_00365 [Bacteroidota bacterium]
MKKQFLILSIFAGLFVTIFLSCESEDTIINMNDSTLEKVSQLTNTYIATCNATNSQKLPRWLTITASDLGGALTGAGTGAGIGSAVGGIGAGFGAIVGGVIGGASASVLMADKLDEDPKGDNGGIIVIGNSNNPYENAGVIHYEIIEKYANDYKHYFSNGELNYNVFVDTALSVLGNYYTDSTNGNYCQYFDTLDYQSDNSIVLDYEDDLVDFISDPKNPLISNFSLDVIDILDEYYSALENSKNYSDFCIYSIQVESTVYNSSQLSTSEKAVLLINMSTTRHGVAYWY